MRTISLETSVISSLLMHQSLKESADLNDATQSGLKVCDEEQAILENS